MPQSWNMNVQILFSLAVIWLAGFLFTRVTRLFNLPNVTGYILSGVLIGPWVLGIIPDTVRGGMGFVTDAALCFIAFDVGRYLHRDRLKTGGRGVLLITVMEAFLAAVIVTLVMRLAFRLSWPFSLLLGAIASATAPASSLMTIRQYRAKGPLVDALIPVVALDDAAALIAFSISAALAEASTSGGAGVKEALIPAALSLASLVVGAAMGLLLSLIITPRRSLDHRLTLAAAFLMGLAGLCAYFDVSPLLGAMAMGAVYANRSSDDQLFTQLNRFTPPVMMLFFVLSGMRMDLSALGSAGVIGITYFFVRIVGKMLGAYLGAKMAKAHDTVQKYLGLALIPQAGVSIGLAALASRLLPPDMGNLLSTIILSSSVLYEIAGPACARLALSRAGCIQIAPRGPGRLDKNTDLYYVRDEEDTTELLSADPRWQQENNRMWVFHRGREEEDS